MRKFNSKNSHSQTFVCTEVSSNLEVSAQKQLVCTSSGPSQKLAVSTSKKVEVTAGKLTKKNWQFSVFGDTAYSTHGISELDAMIKNTMNREDLEFVVHIGDTQVPVPLELPDGIGVSLPSMTIDQMRKRRDILWQLSHPFIITPGDNDWQDLTSRFNGNPPIDPLQALEYFRQVYFREGTNVPFPFEIVSQADEDPVAANRTYIENLRWYIDKIVFITINTTGSNSNGINSPRPAVAAEALIRIAANNAWIERAFDFAQENGAVSVVIMTQADPAGGDCSKYSNWYSGADGTPVSAGFRPMVDLLNEKSLEFGPDFPIRFVYGDAHQFTLHAPFTDPPLDTMRENFTAVQVPGAFTVGRTKWLVDHDEPDLFWLYTSARNQGAEEHLRRPCKSHNAQECVIARNLTLMNTTAIEEGTLLASGTKLIANTSLGDNELVMISEIAIPINPAGTTIQGDSYLVLTGILDAGTVVPIGTYLLNTTNDDFVISGVGVVPAHGNFKVQADSTVVATDFTATNLIVYIADGQSITLTGDLTIYPSSMLRLPVNIPLTIEAILLNETITLPAGTILATGTRFANRKDAPKAARCLV